MAVINSTLLFNNVHSVIYIEKLLSNFIYEIASRTS